MRPLKKTNKELKELVLNFLDQNNLNEELFCKKYNLNKRTFYEFMHYGSTKENRYKEINEKISIAIGLFQLANDEILIGKGTDLIGNRYGRLTVLYRVNPPETIKNKKPHSWWKCQCDCGNTILVPIDRLNNKNTQSCGCLSRELASERFGIDLTGQKFGKLTVVKKDSEFKGHIRWLCQCDCGNPNLESIDGTILRSGKKIYCSLCMPKSQGEEKIREILLNNNISFVQEKTFDNCRFPESNRKARFDFFVQNKYIIEFDGRQHIKETTGKCSNWWSLEYVQKHDFIKNTYCKEHNIPIIRIPYSHKDYLKLEDLLLETSEYIIC